MDQSSRENLGFRQHIVAFFLAVLVRMLLDIRYTVSMAPSLWKYDNSSFNIEDDDFVREVDLIFASPKHAHVRFPDG